MYLKSIYINNFKNFKEREFSFSERINCIIGPNGVGKTNLLDCIFYLSFCKSCFNNIDIANINFDEKYFALQGTYINQNGDTDSYHCALNKDKKKVFKKNDKQYERLSDHIGQVPLIMITPNDILLINGGADERRKYFDAFISQFDNDYLVTVINFNKLLADRNKLLKNESGEIDADLFSVLNERMAYFGDKIFKKRKEVLENIMPIFQKYYNQISDNESVSIGYESQLNKNNLLAMFESSFERDKFMGYTSAGIHRDDYSFMMNDNQVKNFGSQGQKKTFLLALKFTQQEYTYTKTNIKPLLLLDDLFDKLDKTRVQQIISVVSSSLFGQIFISDTDKSNLSTMFPRETANIIDLSKPK
jgi:DNA replication and repair protein RecF